MATRLVIDGNSVYEIDETCQKAGKEFWGNGRRGFRRPCKMAEETGSVQPPGGNSSIMKKPPQ